MKIFKKILLVTTVILSFIIIYGYLELFKPFQFVPDIGKGLNSTIEIAKKEFGERVKATFPIGTHEKSLLVFIDKEKFKLLAPNYNEDDLKRAIFTYSSFPCATDLLITWDTDNDEKIKFIDGNRSVTCL